MRSSATLPIHALGACVNKIRKAALVLTLVLVCSSGLCLGQDEIRSDAEVRSLLTEAAKLTDFYRQSVAEARMEMGDVTGADGTLGRIKDDSQRSEAFRTVGLLQARRGDFEGCDTQSPSY